jgi:hypothetical protein
MSAVPNSIRNEGPDGSDTAVGNFNLGLYYYYMAGEQTTVNLEQKQLLLAKAYFEESRIRVKIYGSTHLGTIDAASQLAVVLNGLSEIELL